MSPDVSPDQWLSLSEASALLGVHASTLRRWADSGRVPCQRTPGGHRRFNRRMLRPMIDGVSYATHREIDPGQASDQPWHGRFVEAGLVDELRELGQRLSGVLLQYLLRTDADGRFLEDGRRLGATYAAESQGAGVDLMNSVRAFLFYRSSLIDIVAQAAAQEPMANARLFGRYDEFMSEVLLGLIGGYEGARSANGQG